MRDGPAPGTAVRIRAPAKVNLLLRILGRRPDGFHALETIFQAVDLCDVLTLSVTQSPGYRLSVVDDAGAPVDVGPVEDNLVTRALDRFGARLAREKPGVNVPGLDVRLVKRIPAGAGLGGGSSDAGALLRALNALLGEPLDPGTLVELGGGLGADVAFFSGAEGRAVGRDRGDVLSSAPTLPHRTLLLGLPPVHVDTGGAYGRLARSREAGGTGPSPILDALLETLEGASSGDGWRQLARVAVNDFEPVVAHPDPDIAEALEALGEAPCEFSLLSGSGAAVFGVLCDGADAEAVVSRLARRTPATRWIAAPTLDRLPATERVVPGREFS